MSGSGFPYSRCAKWLGGAIMLLGVFMFMNRYRKGMMDINELAIGWSWGMVFIFFSKEKDDDEMIRSLKYKALAKAVIITFAATHLFNYIFLNRIREHSAPVFSISAYQFLAVTLLFAYGFFYYSKKQITKTVPNEKPDQGGTGEDGYHAG